MGRHGSAGTGILTGGKAVAGLVAAVVLLGGGYAAYAAFSGDDTPGSTMTTSSSSPTGGSTATSATTPSGATPSESPSSVPTTDAAAQAALDACRSEVTAGESLAKAAAVSARDWGTHAGAQWKLDAGTISYAQAEALWASSKKTGTQDVADFQGADKAFAAVSGKCGLVADATSGSDLAATGTACVARANALTTVATTGRIVNDQWAAHIKQMAGKAHSAGPGYHAEWMQRTTAAKPAIAAYDKAAAALASAPACA